MEYTARFKSIDARVATLDGDGEKVYLLFERGDVRAVVAQSAFEALYVAKDAEAPVVELPRIPKAVKKTVALQPKAPHPWKRKTTESAAQPISGDGRTAEIMAHIRKRPMSSGELIETMRVNSSVVYSTVHVMKGQGLIEGRIDDVDGTRRWFPVESAKGATA